MNHRNRNRARAGGWLLVSLLALYSALLCCTAGPALSQANGGASNKTAPDFAGAQGWLNVAKPLTIKDLRGKVVVLDFWTYCCINCMHIIPKLKELEAKYSNDLVVVGVHSGKFDNERNLDNIKQAVSRYGVQHPVVNDSDYKIWNAYGVTAWPSYIIIDSTGHIRGDYRGENGVSELEPQISKLIEEGRAARTLRSSKTIIAPAKPSTRTMLAFPGKITADSANQRLIISDSGHNRILICDTTGKVLKTIGSGVAGLADGTFQTAKFKSPQGVALVQDDLYIADTENHALRRANLNTASVTTVAGTGQQGKPGEVNSVPVLLNSPWDLCWANNQLYIAMAGFHQIWCYSPSSKKFSVLAGTGRESIKDGKLAEAMFAQPSGLSSDGKHLYIADSESSSIRNIDLAGGTVTTLVGKGLFAFGDLDGKFSRAKLQHPLGVLWSEPQLFVADSYNQKIKVLNIQDKLIKTLAGTGKPGKADSKTDGTSAQFSEPSGLALLNRKLYVADTNNNSVRIVDTATGAVSTLTIH